MDFDQILSLALRNTQSQQDVPSDAPRAGVALLFKPSGLLCMIRRPKKEGDLWSGHMAFPGGREEAFDESLRQTAERETWEEVQIDLSTAKYMGRLHDLVHPRMQIAAFVYVVTEETEGTGSPDEVEKLYWLPFHQFSDKERQGQKTVHYNGQDHSFPVILIGDADVWGISLQFIRDVQQRLEKI